MLPVLVAIGFMLTISLGSSITTETQNITNDALLPECQPDGSIPVICGEINKNFFSFFYFSAT